MFINELLKFGSVVFIILQGRGSDVLFLYHLPSLPVVIVFCIWETGGGFSTIFLYIG